MKIAILPLGHRTLPSSNNTIFAPGTLAVQAAEELTTRGHQVDILAPRDSTINANVISFDLDSMFSQYGETKQTDPGFYFQLLVQYELYLASFLVENSAEYDIIHAHDYRKLMYFSNFAQCPLVYSYHGTPTDDAQTVIDRKRFQRFYHKNYFIAASQRQVDLGKQYLNFVGVVPHGVDSKKIPFQANGVDDSPLLFVGRYMQRKRPDVAIRAAIENNASIQLIGTAYPSPGDEKFFQEQLQPLLSEPGVNDLGFIGHPAIYNYYGSARALLFPTEQEEAFGMVMIEAMATGTPVIAYRYSTAPEIIVDGETGFLVPPGDEAAFTAAVNKIIHLPAQEYQEMRKKCRARVEQYYTVQKMVDGFENIYHQLTAHV